MEGTGDILDHIEATHKSFIEMLVLVFTEFVTSLNASHINHIDIVCKVEVEGYIDIKHIH